MLTVAQVAELLKVSTATVYALCDRGELEHTRVLNSIRVPVAAVERLLCSATGAKTRRRGAVALAGASSRVVTRAENDNETPGLME